MNTNQIYNAITEALQQALRLLPAPILLIAQDHKIKAMDAGAAKTYSVVIAKLTHFQVMRGLTSKETNTIFVTIKKLIQEGVL